MGSKGSNTTTQTGASTYTANPQTQAAGSQALSQAQTAASQPFNLPVAPVAGFTGDQTQAFQQYRDAQGMAQPYYNQAQGLFNQSAGPIGASQINNYLNPYAGYVMQNLQEQQGQQMHDLTGKATQAAGGVGADRIGVAQGELARQQGLANGQTLSGIWGNALSAAQQDAQRQQSAAYGIGNLGGAAQNAALQGTSALYGAGSQQQQLNQAQLNAPYQNELARQAFPYQNAQFLAGITGGLAPALGGTTNSNQTTTAPAPSLFSQIFGGLAGGAGALGATGAFGSNGWLGQAFGDPASYGNGNGVYGGSASNPLPGLTANDYGNRGGRVGFADGGGVPGGGMDWMHSDPTIPQINMQASPMHYPEVKFSSPQQQSGGGGGMGDIAKLAMMFVSRGGAVGPAPYQAYARGGYADGGETQDYVPQDFNSRFVDPGMGELPYAPNFDQRFNAATSQTAPFIPPTPPPTGSPGNPYRMPDIKADGSPIVPEPDSEAPPNATATAGAGAPPNSPYANTTMADNLKSMQGAKFDVPYKDNLPSENDSRSFAKSPWTALMNAGFATMAGTSPFAGVNIGKGFQEGVKTLESQRKEGREEESVNQRAKQLALEAQKHLDQYTKLTPAQAATIENQKATLKLHEDQLEQQGWQKGTERMDGSSTWINPRSGESGVLTPDGKWIPGGASSKTGAPGTVVADASGAVPGKENTPPPPHGIPELASKTDAPTLPPPSLPKQAMPIINNQTKLIDTEIQKKAAMLPDLENNLLSMKSAYATLMKDANKDGFLTKLTTLPGANFGERIERAKQLNSAAAVAGEPPPINPQKLAAAEEIAKIQQRMGAAFAAQISSRPAFAMEKIGINATPGVTNSPEGFLKIIPAFDAAVQNTKDQVASWSEWQKNNPFRPNEWRSHFSNANTADMYYTRSVIDNIPNKKIRDKLPEAVKLLRADPSQENVSNFNKFYNGTASYFLTGKIAPYQGAE